MESELFFITGLFFFCLGAGATLVLRHQSRDLEKLRAETEKSIEELRVVESKLERKERELMRAREERR